MAKTESQKCLLNEPASDPLKRGGLMPVTVDRSPATSRNGNNKSCDNCGHSGDILSQNDEKQRQDSDNESLYLHGLKK